MQCDRFYFFTSSVEEMKRTFSNVRRLYSDTERLRTSNGTWRNLRTLWMQIFHFSLSKKLFCGHENSMWCWLKIVLSTHETNIFNKTLLALCRIDFSIFTWRHRRLWLWNQHWTVNIQVEKKRMKTKWKWNEESSKSTLSTFLHFCTWKLASAIEKETENMLFVCYVCNYKLLNPFQASYSFVHFHFVNFSLISFLPHVLSFTFHRQRSNEFQFNGRMDKK